MRVLVFEQWGGGHYTDYLQYLIPKISELASETILAISSRFYESQDLQRIRSSWSDCQSLQFDLDVPEGNPALPWRDRLKVLWNLREAIQRNKPDYVFVPSGDAQTIALGLVGPFSLGHLSLNAISECILHYGYGPGTTNVKESAKKAVYNTAFAWSSWNRLNFVNCLLFEALAKSDRRDRIGMIPHPTPPSLLLERQEARRLLGCPENGRIVGFVGTMDHRKAIPELLQAFRHARLGMSDRLVLAGRLTPQFAALIEHEYSALRRQERLIVIDRWLTERELQAGYSACDVVCLPYYNFPNLSSLMLRAIAAQRHVLVHDFGWMRAIAKRFDAASVCDIYNVSSFSTAIEGVLERSSQYAFTSAMQALVDYHSPGNFVEHSVATLRNLLGKPTVPLTSWVSVMNLLEPERRALC